MRKNKFLCQILCFVFICTLFPATTPAAAAAAPVILDAADSGDGGGDTGSVPVFTPGDATRAYEFAAVSGELEFTVEDDTSEGSHKEFCAVSFVPSIEESKPFFVGAGPHGISVYTTGDFDLEYFASVAEDYISVEKPALVEAGDTQIRVIDGDPIGDDFVYNYDVIYRVEFHSTKDPRESITLEYILYVYCVPTLVIEVDYNGETRTETKGVLMYNHDIFNSTVTVGVERKTLDSTEAVAEAAVNIFFHWGSCGIFRPFADSVLSGGNGKARFTLGDGSLSIEQLIGVASPALYGKLQRAGSATTDRDQHYVYPDLANFRGILRVRVINTAGEPLPNRNVSFWGAGDYDSVSGDTTGEDGIVEIRFPSTAVENNVQDLTMTEQPRFRIDWNITQVIDNPSRVVWKHPAALYLSPMVSVEEGYFQNKDNQVKDVKLQVYDAAHPETTLIETSSYAFKEVYTDTDMGALIRHRVYIPVSPSVWSSRRLGIRAILSNKDKGVQDGDRIRGTMVDYTDHHDLYVAKKTFTFGFVPLAVGAWEKGTQDFDVSAQRAFFRKIFPAPVVFKKTAPLSVARPWRSGQSAYTNKIFRSLQVMQKRNADKYDFLIGVAPQGLIGAAGLMDPGKFDLNWKILGAVDNAILMDSGYATKHIILHEFLHTRGFEDVYDDDGVKPPSANGHNGDKPIINLDNDRQPSEAIMFDSASNPWPTVSEYESLLDYATKPLVSGESAGTFGIPGRVNLLGRGLLAENGVQDVLLVAGSIEDAASYERKAAFDPILRCADQVDVSAVWDGQEYVLQTLDSEGEILTQHFFSGYEVGGKAYATFMASLPAEGVQTIEIGSQSYGQLDELFKRIEYSTSPPTVVSLAGPAEASLSGEFKLTWQAEDADGDALQTQIEASGDSGATWEMLACGVRTYSGIDNVYSFDAASFPKGSYRFKVVVSDGMRSAEAQTGNYEICGFEEQPVLVMEQDTAQLSVKKGTPEACAFFRLSNGGTDVLDVSLTPDDDGDQGIVSPLFLGQYSISPGASAVIAVPLALPGEIGTDEAEENATGEGDGGEAGEESGTIGETPVPLEQKLTLQTNDGENPITELTITVEYAADDAELTPDLAALLTDPINLAQIQKGTEMPITFKAFAAAGQSGLEATLVIKDAAGDEILNVPLEEEYHTKGAYIYLWEGLKDLAAGKYSVFIGLRDAKSDDAEAGAAGLEYERECTEPDLTFTVLEPNAAPVFTDPTAYENDLGVVQSGEVVTIPFAVSDPDGDALDIQVYSNLQDHELSWNLDAANNSGILTWTANLSGIHNIYLTAADPSGNSAQALFIVTQVEGMNMQQVTAAAEPAAGGRVYGAGYYNPNEYVILRAVPAEGYHFSGWTDAGGANVGEEETLIYKSAGDKTLQANFEREAVFDYDIKDGKAVITGFAGDSVQNLILPDAINGLPVTGVSNVAFNMQGIKSVSLPETLITIGDYAFNGNQLAEITIPNSVAVIGVHAFSNNQLTQAVLPASVNVIGDYAFANNESLVEAVIMNPNAEIGEGAFASCSSALVIYGLPGSTAQTYATETYATGAEIQFKDISQYEGELPVSAYTISIEPAAGGAATITTTPADTAAAGTAVTVNIAGIESGKEFKAITVTDAGGQDLVLTVMAPGQSYTFTMPALPVSVSVELQDASVAPPEVYAVALNGGGTGSSGAGTFAPGETVSIKAGTRPGYSFNGWTSDDTALAEPGTANTTFVMPAHDVAVTATWKAATSSGGSSGSSSGSSERDSNAPAPAPPIPGEPLIGKGMLESKTTTTTEGKTKETVAMGKDAAAQVAAAKKAGEKSIAIKLDDSQADSTEVIVSKEVLQNAAGMGIQIITPNVTLELPETLVRELGNEELSILVEQGDAGSCIKKMQDTGLSATIVGTPTQIHSEIKGSTRVVLPLDGVNLPVDQAQRDNFLAGLAIFASHSDGTKEVLQAKVVYDTGGNPAGVAFTTERFSTFAIISTLQKTTIRLTVNQKEAFIGEKPYTLDALPFIDNDRTMVPVRFISEGLGAGVDWLPETKQVIIQDAAKEIALTIDSTAVVVDQEQRSLDVPAKIIDSRTFVPLRFVAEALGGLVDYDSTAKMITITR